MRVVETIAKQIVALHGLPSPAGRECASPEEAETAARELGGPVYVKAQIPYGDRAVAGLVARADDPSAARERAAGILGREVEATPVASVLVEAAAEPEAAFYLSVHVDDEQRARVLRIGVDGGAGYDRDAAEVSEPLPLRGLEAFEARRLAARLGLSGGARESLARAVLAVAGAARSWHAYTVEINPLFVTADGPLAIDAKIELDDYSIARVPQPELLPAQVESSREREARAYQQSDHRGSFRYVQLVPEGDLDLSVGSHSVGGGESLVVFDALESVGLRPANYCDTSGAPSLEKVAFAARLIASQPHIDAYFFSSCIANQPLSVTANGLVRGFDEASWLGPTVVRIAGNQEAEARAIVEDWAKERGVRAAVVGRELDEWEAARLLADLLQEGRR